MGKGRSMCNGMNMKKQKAKEVKKSAPKKKGSYAWLAGGLVGAALGVAAGLLAESKFGKQLGKEAKDLSADFYHYMVPQIKKVKKMGELEYKKFIAEAGERYSKEKKVSQAEAKHLVKNAQASWKHLKKHL